MVIKVQSIYIKTYSVDVEGNIIEYTKEEKQNAKAKAKDLLNQVKEEDADFYEIASKYSEADEVEYVFGKGEMVEAFETAAYSLKEEQISKLITTDTGYYIISSFSVDFKELLKHSHSGKDKMDFLVFALLQFLHPDQ